MSVEIESRVMLTKDNLCLHSNRCFAGSWRFACALDAFEMRA